jgi:methionyl-tRNA formyltransferase
MTIYHFCNDTFGIPFPPVSAAFAKERGVRIVRVLSVKPEPRSLHSLYWAVRRPAGRAARRAQRFIEGAGPTGEDLPTLYISDVNAPEFRRLIKKRDVAVITGFNQIFSAETIQRFSSFANLHPSILPLYRGPVPTYWCIRNQEPLTGFTLHKVTPKIDLGEPLYQEIVPVEGETDVLELALKVARAAVPMFRRYLEYLAFGGEWVPRFVHANEVYQTHLNYATFPEKQSKPQAR